MCTCLSDVQISTPVGGDNKDVLSYAFVYFSGTACWPVQFQYPSAVHRKRDHFSKNGKDEDWTD